MTTGIRNIATRLVTLLAFLSETLDFVERERERTERRRDEETKRRREQNSFFIFKILCTSLPVFQASANALLAGDGCAALRFNRF